MDKWISIRTRARARDDFSVLQVGGSKVFSVECQGSFWRGGKGRNKVEEGDGT